MSDSVRKYKITDYAGSTRAEIIYNNKLGITTAISTFDYKAYGDTLDKIFKKKLVNFSILTSFFVFPKLT